MKDGLKVNTVIEGDCLEVLNNFPSASIDMVLCDLPYGITHNSWDSVIDLNRLWAHYRRIVKPDGAIILTSQGRFTGQLIMSNTGMFKYKIVWIKSKATNFLNVKKQPLRKHEDICVFYNRQPVYHPQTTAGKPYDRGFRTGLSENYNSFKPYRVYNDSGERQPTDVQFFPDADDYVYFKSEGCWHANQKPVELGRYLVRTYSNSGDIVLDNACGSGSFLVAAALEGRDYIGIELNRPQFSFKQKKADYVKVCMERLQQLKIIGNNKKQ